MELNEAANAAKNPASYSVITYCWVVALSLLGGISGAVRRAREDGRVTLLEIVGELSISDHRSSQPTLDELLRIKQEHQTAMVFISHDLNAISRVADRIVVLNQGLVVDQGDFQHILHHATDSYTKLLVEKRTDVMRRYSQVLGGKERVYA